MWVYGDYLSVRGDFIPVFTEEQDRAHPTAWKSFIPHDTVVAALDTLIRALERGSPSDNRSLWVHGSYGTGKTFAVFVIKHLLEDRLEDIEDYFHNYRRLRELWTRLRAVRQRNSYLVVYRSSCSYVESPLRLLIEVQRAVCEAAEGRGYSSIPAGDIQGVLLERMTDPHSSFNWGNAYLKYRDMFLSSPDAQDVVERVRRGDSDAIERVARVMQREGLHLMDDPRTMKAWLEDVIRQNELGGVVFIWDEFTDFFLANTSVDVLQELAHATSGIPFYFLLVTHRSPEQYQRIDEATRRKLLDRFHTIHLEMRPVTAYQLMANALTTQPNVLKDWEVRRESLWLQVEDSCQRLLDEEARSQDFRDLVPIHPFTAYLLAKIARDFTSSQRTLFRFLKGTHEGEGSGLDSPFRAFLRDCPGVVDRCWFTADVLWDYFFTSDTEVSERVRNVVAHYRARAGSITQEDEQRVFKSLMLLMALWLQTPGEDLLRPSSSNLRLMFAGCPLWSRLSDIEATLSRVGLVHPIPREDGYEYAVPLTTIDQEKLGEVRRQVSMSSSFERLVGTDGTVGKELAGTLALSGAAGRRQRLVTVSAKELRSRREGVSPNIRPYEIGVVLVLAQTDDELAQADEACREMARSEPRILYMLANTPFGDHRMSEWIDLQANAEYGRQVSDVRNSEFYETKGGNVLKEWVAQVERGRFAVYYGDSVGELNKAGYARYFSQRVDEAYPYGPEQVSRVETLYRATYGKVGAEVGLGVAENIQNPYEQVVEELRRQGLWDDPSWSTRRPDHALSMARKELDALVARGQVTLAEVRQTLTSPPFGVIPSPIGILLAGFLFRDYSQGFYYSDGASCFSLDAHKLAELLENLLKERRNSGDYVIRKMLPEAEDFCQLIGTAFGLSPERTAYPEEAVKALRQHLSSLSYPLWAARYALESSDRCIDLADAIGELCRLLGVRDESDVAMGSGELARATEPMKRAGEIVSMLRSREVFVRGMTNFLALRHPALSLAGKRLGVSTDSLVRRLRLMMNEEVWLWEELGVAERLPQLCTELDFVDAVGQLVGGVEVRSLEDAAAHVRSWIERAGCLPLQLIAQAYGSSDPDVGGLLGVLSELATPGGQPKVAGLSEAVVHRLKEKRELVRQAVFNQATALRFWVAQTFSRDISEDQAAQVLTRLPNLSTEARVEQVRQSIRAALDETEKAALVQRVGVQWYEITGTRSPDQWSEVYVVPIEWVLTSDEDFAVINVLNRPQDATLEQLSRASTYMTEHKQALSRLVDKDRVDNEFVVRVAPRYRLLLKEWGELRSVRNHLVAVMGEDIRKWRREQLEGEVDRWIGERYLQTRHESIVRVIEAMSENQAKDALRRLARDPIVGHSLVRGDGERDEAR